VDSTVNTLVNTTPSATFPLSIKRKKHHSKDYEGKIYVADFFSLLADHLSKMTANLFEVQKRLLIIKVMLLSHTVFQVDSVVLKNMQ
jgi:hypothetical protein